nr:AbiH family protein [uncultured Leptotrichia sp.]
MYFFKKKDDIKKKIKNFIEELKESKNYDYSNDILKNYGLIYKLIIKRTEEYKQDKLKEELWESYCNGIVTKIKYINFILENKFLPKLYFKNEEDKKKLLLTSNLNKSTYVIDLLKDLNKFENDFLKYVENLNIPKISDNEIKKIMGDNELYIINFNYTTYLKEYLETNKHFNYKDMLNINGEIKTDLVIFGIDEIQIQNNHRKKELEKFVKSKKGQKDWKLLIKKCEITDFEEIIFFGHSLADADYSTLKEIFDYFNIKDNENIKLIFKTKDKFYNNHKKEIEHFMARYLGKNHKNVMDKIFCIEIV